MTTAAKPKLDELLEDVRRALAPAERAIRSHRYLDALTAGRVPEGSLRAFAGEQFSIIWSDRRSFAHLAGRFPEAPAGDFFLSLAAREGEALSRLGGFAAAVGLGEEELRACEPAPGARPTRPSSPGWRSTARAPTSPSPSSPTSTPGTRTAAALALRDLYGLDDEAVAFLDWDTLAEDI